jgi:hypothetical protein
MTDKASEILLQALKLGLSEPDEQRLYKSGKLAGLFPSRAGPSARAAERALHEGLVELVRTETKGKTTTQWVRPTSKGIQYVRENESPRQALEALRSALQVSRENIPVWLEEIRSEVQKLTSIVVEQTQRWTHRLDTLAMRLDDTLRRSEAGEKPSNNGGPNNVPWALQALTYLDHRRESGAAGECPLPELYHAIRVHDRDLSIRVFHDGLRRLRDRRALRLLPFADSADGVPQPEYALLDGALVLYYAAR